VSVSLDKLGDVQLQAGDLPGALAAYQESLDIARKLAAQDPGNPEWQADLVIGLFKFSKAADPAQARAALTEALSIAERLANEGKLTAERRNWPDALRAALAKLPPA
jgi:tetratricopeptide (TPR) repeat protein